MFQILTLPFILILIASCATTQPPINVSKNYKYDLEISTKDKSGVGLIVLPNKLEQKITVNAPDKLDILFFRSCSRELVIENPSHHLDKSEYVINFKRNEIEQQPYCFINIEAFNKDRLASYGFIDFEDQTATLPALVLCGEKEELFNGVSVCQSRVELLSKIKFNTEVEVETYEGCERILSENNTLKGLSFIIETQPDLCLFNFKTKDGKHHRLTVYGYQDVFIRN